MKRTNIGTLLRYYRKKAKLSVNDVIENLAKEYDILYTDKAVYGWESGRSQPPADTFLILCKMYEISNIIESMGYASQNTKEPLILSDREEELIHKYREHKEHRNAIHKLLDMD